MTIFISISSRLAYQQPLINKSSLDDVLWLNKKIIITNDPLSREDRMENEIEKTSRYSAG